MRLLVLSLLACANPDHEAQLREAFLRDPAAGVMLAQSISDPIARTAAVMAVVEAHPHRSRPLCKALPDRHSIERCERINQRPHLWKTHELSATNDDYPPPSSDPCTLSSHETTCRSAQAIALAKEDKVEPALAECAAINEQRWQSECSFLVGETLAQLSGELDERFSTISRACGLSLYEKSCWHHSLIALCNNSPSWEWSWLQDTEHALIAHAGDKMGIDLADHLWGLCIAARPAPLPESPPAKSLPHIRNRKAMDLLRWADLPMDDPQRWLVAMLKEESIARLRRPRGFLPDHDSWMGTDKAPDAKVVSFLGRSHRLSFADPALDSRSALLEASLRVRPIQRTFVAWAADSENETLRWRAQQLSDSNWTLTPDQRAR